MAMTLEAKQKLMARAFKKSENGKLTYVLIKDNNGMITQNGLDAYIYVTDYGFKLYATCKNGTFTL